MAVVRSLMTLGARSGLAPTATALQRSFSAAASDEKFIVEVRERPCMLARAYDAYHIWQYTAFAADAYADARCSTTSAR